MSRTVTPPAPAKQTTQPSVSVPHESIAMRAYDKWCRRGRPMGTDHQDWLEAEAEIRAEMSRMPNQRR